MKQHLIYCTYNPDYVPKWIDDIKNTKLIYFYDVYTILKDETVFDLLQSRGPVKILEENAKALRIGNAIFKPFNEIQDKLAAMDSSNLSKGMNFRNLYVLSRSSLVLADISYPSYGETYFDILFAWLMGIPIIGLNSSFKSSPWLTDKLNCTINPDDVDGIYRMISVNIKNLEYTYEEQTEKIKKEINEVDKRVENDIEVAETIDKNKSINIDLINQRINELYIKLTNENYSNSDLQDIVNLVGEIKSNKIEKFLEKEKFALLCTIYDSLLQQSNESITET